MSSRRPLGLTLGAAILVVVVLLAILAPWLSPREAVLDVVAMRFLPPLARDHLGTMHVLGTDRLGRDVWRRLLFGARVSLLVGALTMVFTLAIGTAVGLLAAVSRSVVRTLLLAIVDFALGVPRVVLLLLLAVLWPPSAVQVVIVLSVTGWMTIARLVYAETRSQMERTYIEGARALGAETPRLLGKHLLPQVTPLIASATVLGIANAITLEAGLSFLGLGVQPPTPSWGSLIASGRDTVVNAPWVGLAPGVALVVTVIACTLVADALTRRDGASFG